MKILITGINGFVGTDFTEKWKEYLELSTTGVHFAPSIRLLSWWSSLS
jgi:dTDP-4-dehydrorhamnose reductase